MKGLHTISKHLIFWTTFFGKIRYLNRNKLEISHLWAFLKERGNDLATVSNSVICNVLLSNNSLEQRYEIKLKRNAYNSFLYTALSFKPYTISIQPVLSFASAGAVCVPKAEVSVWPCCRTRICKTLHQRMQDLASTHAKSCINACKTAEPFNVRVFRKRWPHQSLQKCGGLKVSF